MNSIPLLPFAPAHLVRALAIGSFGVACAFAADNDLRIVPQITAGTSGIEPGVALEWRAPQLSPLVLRPEVLVSEDGRPGAGAAVLWDFSSDLHLDARQAVAVGPRVIYHNSDESGWEFDAMATWSYSLSANMRPWQHAVGVLGAVGVRDDKENDENDVAFTGGAFYSYRF